MSVPSILPLIADSIRRISIFHVSLASFDIHGHAAVGFVADEAVDIQAVCLRHGSHTKADTLDVACITNDVTDSACGHAWACLRMNGSRACPKLIHSLVKPAQLQSTPVDPSCGQVGHYSLG